MDFLQNIDLLSVGLASAAIGILGAVVFFSNGRSATNQAFLGFSVITILWSIFNYLGYKSTSPYFIIWFLRLAIFLAIWHAFFLFQLFLVFPRDTFSPPRWYRVALLPLIFITSGLTLTPAVFNHIGAFSEGRVSEIVNGPGIALFSLVIFILVGGAMYLLFRKTRHATGIEKVQFRYISFGFGVTFLLIIIFNFILPAFLNNARFIPLGAVFLFPFAACTAYAIIRYKLLNIKVITTEVIVFFLAAATLLEIALSESALSLLLRIIIFILVLLFGIILIRSVRKEVEQRERLQVITSQLQVANARLEELDRQKTDFLSIAAHQLRTPLSIMNGYIELIKDGAYGKVAKQTKKILNNMDESNGHLVKLIDEFLNITRIEQGRTKYDFKKLDLNAIITGVVEELKKRAEQKGLAIKWQKSDVPPVMVDEEKIRHVIYNFVDNAIKYSDKGAVTVRLALEEGGVTLRVQDRGFGFNKTDEVNFFQKFYRGENVRGTNVNGTGLGLYVCRMFIEGHEGRVWAHSPGLGKGSEFGFWVPFTE